MELSIEEARKEIAGHAVEHIRNGTHPQARCCLAVADGYALAVAKEIFREHHAGRCGIWAAAYNDLLIEQIEALSKEGQGVI